MQQSRRDDFKRAVAQNLAKRAAFRCSNPDCRNPTSGPSADTGAVNVGVAAHITAAAPGGSRYDSSFSNEQRSSEDNGIWMCQNCSRIIDADPSHYSVELLKDWKHFAESAAFIELHGFDIIKKREFKDLEEKMPDLIAEMRSDLQGSPYTREFVALRRRQTYTPGETPQFAYYINDHQDLLGKLQIFENYSAIFDTSYTNVKRYRFNEDFVDYLLGPG